MSDFFGRANYFIENMPFVFWSALIFYILLTVVCCIPALRRKVPVIFNTSVSSAQSSIASLDSFRGLAALWVFCFHTWYNINPVNSGMKWFPFVQTGGMAVPLFAALSGFLVYRSLRNKSESADDISKYAKRRFFRIYPLYIATALVALLFDLTGLLPLGESKRAFIGDLFMLRIFGFPDFCGTPSWNAPAWSLFIEVVFYIVLPVFVVTVKKRIFVAALFGFLLLASFGVTMYPVYFLVFKYFFVGIMLCEITFWEKYKQFNGYWAGLVFAAGLALLLLLCIGYPIVDNLLDSLFVKAGFSRIFVGHNWHDSYSITLGIASFMILLGGMKFQPAFRLLSIYPLRFIGVISYSIYLWHFFLIRITLRNLDLNAGAGQGNMTTFLVFFLPAMLLYATISYALIERPFLNLRPK